MNNFTNPMDNIKIASPCAADWDAMIGNERSRHCGDCKLNVYNLSDMTRREAENFLIQAEGRVCVRYFKRADGTVLTVDCPVGWRAVKQRISKKASACASLVFAALGGIGLAGYFAKAKTENHTLGVMVRQTENTAPVKNSVDENSNTAFQGAPEAFMGNMTVPQYTMGEMSNPKEVQGRIVKKQRR